MIRGRMSERKFWVGGSVIWEEDWAKVGWY